MSFGATALRELHRIHRQLADLRDRLERGPRQIKAKQAGVSAAEQRLATVQAESKTARVAVDQKQLQLRSGESKILDLRAKLNACGTNREYQLLKEQIAGDEMTNSVLSDEILEGLEKLDLFKPQIAEANGMIAKAKEELTKAQDAVRSQEETLRGDMTRTEGQLKEAEMALPEDFRDAYYRVVRARGQDAMAQVEGETCGGCNQQLTPNLMAHLMAAKAIFCKTCGRLLYLPEDRTPGAARKPSDG